MGKALRWESKDQTSRLSILYIVGNYTQDLVITYNGKEYEKERVCVCV